VFEQLFDFAKPRDRVLISFVSIEGSLPFRLELLAELQLSLGFTCLDVHQMLTFDVDWIIDAIARVMDA